MKVERVENISEQNGLLLMVYRISKTNASQEIHLQPCYGLQLAQPGWCLVSLLFLYGISFTGPVALWLE